MEVNDICRTHVQKIIYLQSKYQKSQTSKVNAGRLMSLHACIIRAGLDSLLRSGGSLEFNLIGYS